MSQEINLGGTIYISSRRGAEITGYTQDYIGQLARSGAIDARRVSGLWYLLESSLIAHKEKAEQFIPTPPQKIREIEQEASVSFGGKDYISASRASEISGYNQDYVTQLAREGKIVAEQSANRWYIEEKSLLEHKKEKDSLLAAVQSEAVGIRDTGEMELKIPKLDDATGGSHFIYTHEGSRELLPIRNEEPREETTGQVATDAKDGDFAWLEYERPIPIRVVSNSRVEEEERGAPPQRLWSVFRMFAGLATLGILAIGVLFLLNNFRPQLLALNTHFRVPEFVKGIIGNELVFSRQQDF